LFWFLKICLRLHHDNVNYAILLAGILAPTEENIEALSPVASTASRLLKSGMTLTQVSQEKILNFSNSNLS
jgi:hypothetical protein